VAPVFHPSSFVTLLDDATDRPNCWAHSLPTTTSYCDSGRVIESRSSVIFSPDEHRTSPRKPIVNQQHSLLGQLNSLYLQSTSRVLPRKQRPPVNQKQNEIIRTTACCTDQYTGNLQVVLPSSEQGGASSKMDTMSGVPSQNKGSWGSFLKVSNPTSPHTQRLFMTRSRLPPLMATSPH
jgi:hypothetical protein